MKKLLSLLFVVIVMAACNSRQDVAIEYPTLFAHRGCWNDVIPENSCAAVAMAARMGYSGIECDVHYTSDNVMVILHDATLNRTARYTNGYTSLTDAVYLSQLTYKDLCNNYILSSPDESLRTSIPTLEEFLQTCKQYNIIPMLHSELVESYRMAQEVLGNEWICFTGNVDSIMAARQFSDCMVLLAINDGTARENIDRLRKIGGHCGVSTMNYNLLTSSFCDSLKAEGYEIQASIFPTPHEVAAQSNGVTFQLTDFSFMPKAHIKPTYIIDGDDDNMQLFTEGQPLYEEIECGGVTLAIKFTGDVSITMNGTHHYTLTSDGKETQYIGNRFFGKAPCIKITPNNATIEHIQAKIYKM